MSSRKVVERLDIAKVMQENSDCLNSLVVAGMIDPVWIMRLEIWLEFKELEEEMPKAMKRYYKISNRRNISVPTVRRAIDFFK
ncbi:hypothetical protein [Ekhidna sp.]